MYLCRHSVVPKQHQRSTSMVPAQCQSNAEICPNQARPSRSELRTFRRSWGTSRPTSERHPKSSPIFVRDIRHMVGRCFGILWALFNVSRLKRDDLLPSEISLAHRQERVPNAGVGFARLLPGAEIKPHFATEPRLAVHLGLVTPPGASMTVADQAVTWAAGQAVVFDDTYVHSVRHHGDEPRFVLLAWICHPCDAEWRQGVSGDPASEAALMDEELCGATPASETSARMRACSHHRRGLVADRTHRPRERGPEGVKSRGVATMACGGANRALAAVGARPSELANFYRTATKRLC